MLRSIRDILICICLVSVSFSETQYADILVEGDVKSYKSYWTINPVTFRPLKILSKGKPNLITILNKAILEANDRSKNLGENAT